MNKISDETIVWASGRFCPKCSDKEKKLSDVWGDGKWHYLAFGNLDHSVRVCEGCKCKWSV